VRALVVSQYFYPENFRINDIVRSLVEKGIEVDILTGKPNYPEGKFFEGYRGWGCQHEQWAGADIYRVPLAARGAKGGINLVINYLSFVISGLVFGPWLLRKRRYDVIFVYAPSPLLQAIPALFLGFLKRTKVITWIQDLWPESLIATGYVRNAFILQCVERAVRLIYRHSDLLLVQSQAFKESVQRLAPGKPLVYYPNSVDAIFSASTAVSPIELPLAEGGFSVVFAGNVGNGQGMDVIIDAATLLHDRPDVSFVIFGQGSRWEWMQREVRKRGLKNLHLPGRFPVEMMPGVMRKASALLVTLADQPIFALTVPSKLQAYMAVGRPIIACLNGEGARLVVEAGAGLAVAAGNASMLADAILRMVGMTIAERELMGCNGQAYFKQNFDHDSLIDQLIAYFHDVHYVD
jgi:glycosyltransferase involved in cell wall biosynthesis